MSKRKYQKTPWNKEKKKSSFLNYVFGIPGVLILLYAVSIIPVNILKNHLLNTSSIVTTAVVIDDENYFGNNTRRFSHSYQFQVEGKAYSGDTHNSKYRIGETVKIKYVPDYPRFNELLEQE